MNNAEIHTAILGSPWLTPVFPTDSEISFLVYPGFATVMSLDLSITNGKAMRMNCGTMKRKAIGAESVEFQF